jgi:hypothetical protein
MAPFLSGAVCCAYVIAALLFLKSWKKTGDPLFVLFAIAFGILAAEQVALTKYSGINRPEIYLLRLLAFGLIVVAIIRKNKR